MDLREFLHRLFGIVLLPIAMRGPFNFIRLRANRLRGVKIGKGSWVGYEAFIDQPPEMAESMVEIGDDVGIGFRNTIFTHDSSPVKYGGKGIFKKVKIENGVYLGCNVTILPGVTIGEGAVVGACALVNKDIPPYTLAVGIPARPVKKVPRKGEDLNAFELANQQEKV